MLETLPMTARFRLREILEARGISQTELAREAEVSFATVSRLCTNATGQVSLETLDKLSAYLKLEPGDLIERVGRKRKR
jgi:DNA-binding Xre family transcriptional regulator